MFPVKLTRVFLRKANNSHKYGIYRLGVLLSVASQSWHLEFFSLMFLALCFVMFLVLRVELSVEYEVTAKLMEAASCDEFVRDQRLS
ncbi:hypothetical protein T06_7623 [Trichinella sp. T6]|nr:hypothetical protein T06_7623 [Trichinella sp. T6]